MCKSNNTAYPTLRQIIIGIKLQQNDFLFSGKIIDKL